MSVEKNNENISLPDPINDGIVTLTPRERAVIAYLINNGDSKSTEVWKQIPGINGSDAAHHVWMSLEEKGLIERFTTEKAKEEAKGAQIPAKTVRLTDRGGVFAATHRDTIEALDADWEVESEVARLRREFHEVDESAGKASTKAEKAREDVDELRDEVDELGNAVAGARSYSKQLSDDLASQFAEHIDRIDGRLDEMDERLDRVEDQQSETASEVDELGGEVGRVDNEIGRVESKYDDVLKWYRSHSSTLTEMAALYRSVRKEEEMTEENESLAEAIMSLISRRG